MSKDNHSDKIDKYWQDMATILFRMKRFQKEVLKARKKLGIPETGIPFEERAQWHQKFFINPDIDIDKEYGPRSVFQLLPPNKKLMDVITELADNFNLDDRWYVDLYLHISSNSKLGAPFGKPQIDARLNDVRLPRDKWVVKRLWIDIEKDTTLKDISSIWNRVEEYQSMMKSDLPQKRRPLKPETVKKYLKIRDMEDQGKSHDQIAKDLKILSYHDVSLFKQDIESRFSPRKK